MRRYLSLASDKPKKVTSATCQHVWDRERFPRPWALEIAFNCLDLETGAWKHLPRAGGWHEQDDDELAVVWWAWRVWKHLKDDRSHKWSDAGEVMLMIDAAQEDYGGEEMGEDEEDADTPCGAPWEW